MEFEKNLEIRMPFGTKIGCGVTAFDKAQALKIVEEKVFLNKQMPAIARIVEHVDVRNLDPGHVQPNMGNPAAIGVWFPLGY